MNEYVAMLIDHELQDALWAGAFVAMLSALGWLLVRLLNRLGRSDIQAIHLGHVTVDIKQIRQHVEMEPYPYPKSTDPTESEK